jgi:hypothetical protein
VKIPHAQGVARALRNVRTAAKKTLKGLNQVAGQRMSKGDYAAAETLAAKGREIRQFVQQSDELLRTWRGLSGRGAKTAGKLKGESTPLWAYYQPILKAIVTAGGECARDDIEAAFERSSDGFLQPADRQLMTGGRERWKVMIRRVRKPLRAEGWIQEGPGKTWKITAAGRRAAEQPPSANRTARSGSTDAHEA